MANTPYSFFDLRVVRAERLSPSFVRVTFGGPELASFVNGGRDQRLKIFLPQPGQEAPVVPRSADLSWYPEWRAMDPAVRGVMRTYTVREHRRDPHEVDIDFALHGDTGPASRWAATAAPGDRVTLLGPSAEENGGVDFQPPGLGGVPATDARGNPRPATTWVLITADETALPAVASTLAWLPAGTPAKVWIEVQHAEDRQALPTKADADVTWLVRDETPAPEPAAADVQLAHGQRTLDAVRAAELPDGTPYAWVAGESSTVRALRRHLVGERGFDRRAVKFTGYWRQGTSEDQLLDQEADETDDVADAGDE
ncbi:siderophore-interacting protein [Streptomyces sp. AC536]|uniref:siderophore-interacting protein n=1 Tax=Streptomyces buecherae TaxID=2763006 RepID=UPI00164D0FB4|nr:siderophore-interacting protein [Streptomyces buecherae]MBC3985854.1 siderophore-interacting protein [Streptomyces buecherae]QNJ43172.1 siderophore-interacting protein [Streptomyces buecherae]